MGAKLQKRKYNLLALELITCLKGCYTLFKILRFVFRQISNCKSFLKKFRFLFLLIIWLKCWIRSIIPVSCVVWLKRRPTVIYLEYTRIIYKHINSLDLSLKYVDMLDKRKIYGCKGRCTLKIEKLNQLHTCA